MGLLCANVNNIKELDKNIAQRVMYMVLKDQKFSIEKNEGAKKEPLFNIYHEGFLLAVINPVSKEFNSYHQHRIEKSVLYEIENLKKDAANLDYHIN